MAARIMPGLGLRAGYANGESGWGGALTEDLRTLSAVVQLSVISDSTALPGTGTTGDILIVPEPSPDAGKVAVWDGSWVFIVPSPGWVAFIEDDGLHKFFDGADWIALTPGLVLPDFVVGDALKVLRIDALGTGLVWATPRELPNFVIGDATKFLRINTDGDDFEWVDMAESVPAYVVGDALKVMRVNAAGTGLEWVAPESLPTFVVGDALKVLRVSAAGTSLEWVTQASLPTISGGDALKVLRVKAAEDGPEWASFRALPTISGGDALKVLRVNAAETGVEWATPSGGGGAVPTTSVINTASTAITLDNTHFAGSVVLCTTSATAVTITMPLGLTGTEPLTVLRSGAGSVTFSAGAGADIQSADTKLALRVQFSGASVIRLDSASFALVGDLA